MKNFFVKRTLIFCLALVLVVSFTPPLEATQAPAGARPLNFAHPALKRGAMDAYLHLPLYFIANQGQQDERVAYYTQGNGYSIYFTAEEMVMALHDTVVQVRFVGAKATPPLGVEKTAAKVNHLTGNDPARWRTDIPTYGQVVYHDLYPGIDLSYGGQNGALKYTFVAQPGADVSLLRLAFGGAAGLRLDQAGNLLILAGESQLKDTRPYAYQEIGGRRVEVETEFVLYGVRTCGFAVRGAYDPRYPLIIDPTLLYSTYLGGNGEFGDRGNSIALDGNGSAYVTGVTTSTNFPIWNPFQGIFGGGIPLYGDAFVTKFNADGNALLYSTFLGGTDWDWGNGIAVDGDGNAYVTGETKSSDFPTYNAYDDDLSGSRDAFVTKLSAAGNALLYSTYLGGDSKEGGIAIAVDGEGNAHVTGYTKSLDFPLENPFQNKHGDGDDAFVTKFSADGSALVYSTYLGGRDGDHGNDITVDAAGNAYVTGYTESANFPRVGSYQIVHGGGSSDVFVAKINGNVVFYSTFLGHDGGEWGEGIAVDGVGNAYVTGVTSSSDFPILNAYQRKRAGGNDAFVAKFNFAGNALFYSTFLGGSGNDGGIGIGVDNDGNAYVAGYTDSTNFPNTLNAYQGTNGGNLDVFFAELNATGNALLYSTYLGGSGNDESSGIAVNGEGSAYLTGTTGSTNFPLQNPFQMANAGYDDIFVTAFAEERSDLSTSSKQVSPTTIVPTGTVTHTLFYNITLANTGNVAATNAYLTDTLPVSLTLSGAPSCFGGGTCSYNASNHTITWRGSLVSNASVVINYSGTVRVPTDTVDTIFFINEAVIDDGINAPFTRKALSAVNPRHTYLPFIQKH